MTHYRRISDRPRNWLRMSVLWGYLLVVGGFACLLVEAVGRISDALGTVAK